MKLLAFILIMEFCFFADAGVIGGGGGKGVVCRDSQNKIMSVELLDLWEARVVFGRTLHDSSSSLSSQIDDFLNELKYSIQSDNFSALAPTTPAQPGAEALKDQLEFYTGRFLVPAKMIHWLKGAKLELTSDSYEAATPEDCKVEQIVRYADTYHGGDALVNKDLYDKMSVSNQAALIAHEAFYAILRSWYGEKSSIQVRRAIGLIAGGHHFTNPSSVLPFSEKHWVCADTNNLIHILEFPTTAGNASYTIFPEMIAHHALVGYEKGDFPTWGAAGPASLFGWLQDYNTMGNAVGFDYSYRILLAKDNKGKEVAHVYLDSAPDEAKSITVENMPCFMQAKGP